MDFHVHKKLLKITKQKIKEFNLSDRWDVFSQPLHPGLGEKSDWEIIFRPKNIQEESKPIDLEKFKEEISSPSLLEFLKSIDEKAYFATQLVYGIQFPIRLGLS